MRRTKKSDVQRGMRAETRGSAASPLPEGFSRILPWRCLSALAGRVSGRGVSSAHLRKRSPSASTRASRRLGNCRQRPRKLHVSLMPRTSRRMRTANSRGRTCETPVNPQAAAVNRIISWADQRMKLKRLTRACGVLPWRCVRAVLCGRNSCEQRQRTRGTDV